MLIKQRTVKVSII